MRNNSQLGALLKDFEDCWTFGTEHLLNAKHRMHLAAFGGLLENVAERHASFRYQLESCDTQVFLSIPALAVLYNLQEIVHRFAPSLSIASVVAEVNASGMMSQIEGDVLESSCGLKIV